MAVTEQEKKDIVQLSLNEVYNNATQLSDLSVSQSFDTLEGLLGKEGERMVKVPKSYLGLDEIAKEEAARKQADNAEKSARESGDRSLQYELEQTRDDLHSNAARVDAPFDDVMKTLPADAMQMSTIDEPPGSRVLWVESEGRFYMHRDDQPKIYYGLFPSSFLYNDRETNPLGGKRFYNKQNGIYYKVEAGRLVEDYSFADSQIEDLDHRFENEQQNRMDEDDKIKRHIDDLEEGVKNADKLLSQRITDLEKGVADADKFLSDRITTEQTARTEADNALREVTDSYTEHMKAEHYNHRPIVIANFYKLSNPTSEQIRAAFLPAGRTIMDLHDRLREGVEMVMTKDDNPANRYGKFEVCRCHSVSMELTGDHTGFSLWFGVNLFGSNKTVERFYQIKLLNGVFTCSYYTNG